MIWFALMVAPVVDALVENVVGVSAVVVSVEADAVVSDSFAVAVAQIGDSLGFSHLSDLGDLAVATVSSYAA